MLCSGCGKEIPFTGQVCPYCQRDKTSDQAIHAGAILCGLFGFAIGYALFGLLWAIVGSVVGVILGFVAAGLGKNESSSTAAPLVRLDADSAERTEARPVEDRLEQLDALKRKAIISEDEYREKRAAILKEL